MPFKLLVRAEDAPVDDSAGKWRQGDIVEIRPDLAADGQPIVWGNKEQLPYVGSTIRGGGFIRVRISNTSNGDLGWLQEDTDAEGNLTNRRSVRVDPAEVEAVKALWADRENPDFYLQADPREVHVEYTRSVFNSRVVTRQ